MVKKILVVEDESELRAALRVRLTASGFACETASNGREALSVLARWQPDMIVADLLMPEMDGYALCRQVRADPKWAHLPILILSAVPRQVIDREAELKASRIMRKPFDSAELLAAIRELLSENGGQ